MKYIVYSTDDKRFKSFVNENKLKLKDIIRITKAKSVGEAYNSVDIGELDDDYNVFVHDDVRFTNEKIKSQEGLIKKILEQEPKSVIGVAGSKVYSPQYQVRWWCYNNSLCGSVVHKSNHKTWTTTFGPVDSRYKYNSVQVVDGLLMVMSKEFMKTKPFSNSKANHFYDIRACMLAKECYVIDFEVTHLSTGGGSNSSAYNEEAKLFLRDYSIGSL